MDQEIDLSVKGPVTRRRSGVVGTPDRVLRSRAEKSELSPLRSKTSKLDSSPKRDSTPKRTLKKTDESANLTPKRSVRASSAQPEDSPSRRRVITRRRSTSLQPESPTKDLKPSASKTKSIVAHSRRSVAASLSPRVERSIGSTPEHSKELRRVTRSVCHSPTHEVLCKTSSKIKDSPPTNSPKLQQSVDRSPSNIPCYIGSKDGDTSKLKIKLVDPSSSSLTNQSESKLCKKLSPVKEQTVEVESETLPSPEFPSDKNASCTESEDSGIKEMEECVGVEDKFSGKVENNDTEFYEDQNNDPNLQLLDKKKNLAISVIPKPIEMNSLLKSEIANICNPCVALVRLSPEIINRSNNETVTNTSDLCLQKDNVSSNSKEIYVKDRNLEKLNSDPVVSAQREDDKLTESSPSKIIESASKIIEHPLSTSTNEVQSFNNCEQLQLEKIKDDTFSKTSSQNIISSEISPNSQKDSISNKDKCVSVPLNSKSELIENSMDSSKSIEEIKDTTSSEPSSQNILPIKDDLKNNVTDEISPQPQKDSISSKDKCLSVPVNDSESEFTVNNMVPSKNDQEMNDSSSSGASSQCILSNEHERKQKCVFVPINDSGSESTVSSTNPSKNHDEKEDISSESSSQNILSIKDGHKNKVTDKNSPNLQNYSISGGDKSESMPLSDFESEYTINSTKNPEEEETLRSANLKNTENEETADLDFKLQIDEDDIKSSNNCLLNMSNSTKNTGTCNFEPSYNDDINNSSLVISNQSNVEETLLIRLNQTEEEIKENSDNKTKFFEALEISQLLNKGSRSISPVSSSTEEKPITVAETSSEVTEVKYLSINSRNETLNNSQVDINYSLVVNVSDDTIIDSESISNKTIEFSADSKELDKSKLLNSHQKLSPSSQTHLEKEAPAILNKSLVSEDSSFEPAVSGNVVICSSKTKNESLSSSNLDVENTESSDSERNVERTQNDIKIDILVGETKDKSDSLENSFNSSNQSVERPHPENITSEMSGEINKDLAQTGTLDSNIESDILKNSFNSSNQSVERPHPENITSEMSGEINKELAQTDSLNSNIELRDKDVPCDDVKTDSCNKEHDEVTSGSKTFISGTSSSSEMNKLLESKAISCTKNSEDEDVSVDHTVKDTDNNEIQEKCDISGQSFNSNDSIEELHKKRALENINFTSEASSSSILCEVNENLPKSKPLSCTTHLVEEDASFDSDKMGIEMDESLEKSNLLSHSLNSTYSVDKEPNESDLDCTSFKEKVLTCTSKSIEINEEHSKSDTYLILADVSCDDSKPCISDNDINTNRSLEVENVSVNISQTETLTDVLGNSSVGVITESLICIDSKSDTINDFSYKANCSVSYSDSTLKESNKPSNQSEKHDDHFTESPFNETVNEEYLEKSINLAEISEISFESPVVIQRKTVLGEVTSNNMLETIDEGDEQLTLTPLGVTLNLTHDIDNSPDETTSGLLISRNDSAEILIDSDTSSSEPESVSSKDIKKDNSGSNAEVLSDSESWESNSNDYIDSQPSDNEKTSDSERFSTPDFSEADNEDESPEEMICNPTVFKNSKGGQKAETSICDRRDVFLSGKDFLDDEAEEGDETEELTDSSSDESEIKDVFIDLTKVPHSKKIMKFDVTDQVSDKTGLQNKNLKKQNANLKTSWVVQSQPEDTSMKKRALPLSSSNCQFSSDLSHAQKVDLLKRNTKIETHKPDIRDKQLLKKAKTLLQPSKSQGNSFASNAVRPTSHPKIDYKIPLDKEEPIEYAGHNVKFRVFTQTETSPHKASDKSSLPFCCGSKFKVISTKKTFDSEKMPSTSGEFKNFSSKRIIKDKIHELDINKDKRLLKKAKTLLQPSKSQGNSFASNAVRPTSHPKIDYTIPLDKEEPVEYAGYNVKFRVFTQTETSPHKASDESLFGPFCCGSKFKVTSKKNAFGSEKLPSTSGEFENFSSSKTQPFCCGSEFQLSLINRTENAHPKAKFQVPSTSSEFSSKLSSNKMQKRNQDISENTKLKKRKLSQPDVISEDVDNSESKRIKKSDLKCKNKVPSNNNISQVAITNPPAANKNIISVPISDSENDQDEELIPCDHLEQIKSNKLGPFYFAHIQNLSKEVNALDLITLFRTNNLEGITRINLKKCSPMLFWFSRGYGEIQFSNEESLQKCIDKSRSLMIKGKPIRMRACSCYKPETKISCKWLAKSNQQFTSSSNI